MTLLVDHREHDEMKRLVRHFINMYAPDSSKTMTLERLDLENIEIEDVEFTTLDVGDYADPEHGFAVERKSDDFIPEVFGGALFQKLSELAQFPNSALVVDISLEECLRRQRRWVYSRKDLSQPEKGKEWNKQRVAIMGAIASCWKRGFPPQFFTSKKEAAEFIVRAYYKAKDGKDRRLVTAVRPKATQKDKALNILLAFPYVGTKTAEALLEECDNLTEIFGLLKDLFVEPDKERMRRLGLNKRNLAQSVALLEGVVEKEVVGLK